MNTNLISPNKVKNFRRMITVVSVVIPVVVAALFRIKLDGITMFKDLPMVYAGINALTAVLLVLALIAIKNKKQNLHQNLIKTCLVLSLLFLACYVAYHMTNRDTEYQGAYKALYYPLLISHIILSVAVIPVVLFTYMYAWIGDFQRHKKWARYTWPLWFYVAVSGVLVYLMISPYYV